MSQTICVCLLLSLFYPPLFIFSPFPIFICSSFSLQSFLCVFVCVSILSSKGQIQMHSVTLMPPPHYMLALTHTCTHTHTHTLTDCNYVGVRGRCEGEKESMGEEERVVSLLCSGCSSWHVLTDCRVEYTYRIIQGWPTVPLSFGHCHGNWSPNQFSSASSLKHGWRAPLWNSFGVKTCTYKNQAYIRSYDTYDCSSVAHF